MNVSRSGQSMFRSKEPRRSEELALDDFTENRLLGCPLHKFDVGWMNGHVFAVFP